MKAMALTLLSCIVLLVGCTQQPDSYSSSSSASEPNSVSSSSSSSQASSLPDSSSVSEPSSPQPPVPAYDGPVAQFKAGPNGNEVVSLGVGDQYLGLTLISLEATYFPDDFYYSEQAGALESIQADFTGEVTVTGLLTIRPGEPYGATKTSFSVDAISLSKLPYAIGDTRDVWFSFDNEEEALSMFNMDSCENFPCTITISEYKIWFAYAGVYNLAKITQYAPQQ